MHEARGSLVDVAAGLDRAAAGVERRRGVAIDAGLADREQDAAVDQVEHLELLKQQALEPPRPLGRRGMGEGREHGLAGIYLRREQLHPDHVVVFNDTAKPDL